jgi:flagellar secretion chaperone FliS
MPTIKPEDSLAASSMSAMKQKYQAYAAATQTVAKTRQIVMLYDGAIRFVHQAKEAIRERRIEDRYNLLIKASSIINGLQNCLDFEKGGKVAKILYQYYASIDQRLFAIQRSNNIQECDQVLSDLKQMRDVWQEIDQGVITTPEQSGAAGASISTGTAQPGIPPITHSA